LCIGDERRPQQNLHEEVGVPDSTLRRLLYQLEEKGIVRRFVPKVKLSKSVDENLVSPLAKRVLALLERKPISYFELVRELESEGFTPRQINRAMNELARLGAVEEMEHYTRHFVELTEVGKNIFKNLIEPWCQIALDVWEPPSKWEEKVRENFDACVRVLQDRAMNHCISISRALKDEELLKRFDVEFSSGKGYVFVKKSDATLLSSLFSMSLKRGIVIEEDVGVSPIFVGTQIRLRRERLTYLPWARKMWQEQRKERTAYVSASEFLRCWLNAA